MYRFVKMFGKWYGYKFEHISDEANNITQFVEDGDIVVLCSDIDDFTKMFDIDEDEYIIVEPEES